MESLYDKNGNRLYMTEQERLDFLSASALENRQIKALCHVLVHTGCRISEALSITPRLVDLSDKTLRFRTLKQRKKEPVYRSVPVPTDLLEMLENVYGIQEIQRKGAKKEMDAHLFPWHRSYSWLVVKRVMDNANVPDGAHKTPKGLRHGYGIQAMKKGVQLNMLQKWMGHANIKNTIIYADAMGDEEREIAARMWG